MSHEDTRTFVCDVCARKVKSLPGDDLPYLPPEWFEVLNGTDGSEFMSIDLCHDCYWDHGRFGWFHEIVKQRAKWRQRADF